MCTNPVGVVGGWSASTWWVLAVVVESERVQKLSLKKTNECMNIVGVVRSWSAST